MYLDILHGFHDNIFSVTWYEEGFEVGSGEVLELPENAEGFFYCEAVNCNQFVARLVVIFLSLGPLPYTLNLLQQYKQYKQLYSHYQRFQPSCFAALYVNPVKPDHRLKIVNLNKANIMHNYIKAEQCQGYC